MNTGPDDCWSEVGNYVCMILLSAFADENTDKTTTTKTQKY